MLRKFACDVAVLQESKMEEVERDVVVSLWGRRTVERRFLPSVGRSGGIIILWDPQVLELVDSRVGCFSMCCIFKSLHDSFVWGLIGVYGPNDDRVRGSLFEEPRTFIRSWDVPWCLGGDFNVVRLRGRMEAD